MIRFRMGDTLYWQKQGNTLHLANTTTPPVLVHVAEDTEQNRADLRDCADKLQLTIQAVDFGALTGDKTVVLAEAVF